MHYFIQLSPFLYIYAIWGMKLYIYAFCVFCL